MPDEKEWTVLIMTFGMGIGCIIGWFIGDGSPLISWVCALGLPGIILTLRYWLKSYIKGRVASELIQTEQDESSQTRTTRSLK